METDDLQTGVNGAEQACAPRAEREQVDESDDRYTREYETVLDQILPIFPFGGVHRTRDALPTGTSF